MGAPKKTKKKIEIEEIDSGAASEAPKKAKKKIVVEEGDSGAASEAPKKAKKKIVVEEVESDGSSLGIDTSKVVPEKQAASSSPKASSPTIPSMPASLKWLRAMS